MRLLIVLSLALTPYMALAEKVACDLLRQRDVFFSSEDLSDVMSVKIKGAPCSEAELTIYLDSKGGERLYSYTGKLLKHFPYLVVEPDLSNIVGLFADKVLSEAILRSTADLPEYMDRNEYYQDSNEFIEVSKKEYNALLEQDYPILWHLTGEATWTNIIYDPKQKKVLILLSGGVDLGG